MATIVSANPASAAPAASRLDVLRSQLDRLRRARVGLRAVAAWSALASSLVIALLFVLALDLLFDLAVPQRVVVLLLTAGAVAWAYWRFTRPLLGHHETMIDVALAVERQHQIDSDLVAALQFERADAAAWGSAELTGAVVNYVAAAAPTINVFAGISRAQMRRRLAVLAGALAVLLLAALGWPAHMAAFANRLLLGSAHYPTRTRIEQIVINQTPVLRRPEHGAAPIESKAAQGRPLNFVVQCAGQLPASGTVQLMAASGSHSHARLPLAPLSLDQRLARLQTALSKLNEANENPPAEISPAWRGEILGLIQFDCQEAAALLSAANKPLDLPAVRAAIEQQTAAWPGDHKLTMLLIGELARLNDDVTYRISAGDAWSDPAVVRMIPLPIIEVDLAAVPPKYAAASAPKPDPSGRQAAVLEGSTIELTVKCINGKPLKAAWLSLRRSAASERIDLAPRDNQQLRWSPRAGGGPLAHLREELRYEVQVIDSDGLSLETPIRGTIRIRPDRPPTGIAEVVHRVILPTAEPVIAYRASDDYGISRVAVVVDIERGADQPAGQAAQSDQPAADAALASLPQTAATESHRFEIVTNVDSVSAQRLPLTGRYPLSLSPLKLAKGDRLKLTLEVTDYRGENDAGQPTGVSERCDPVVLDVSDESGVLAAISQPDERSAEQLSEIIKRQLGIGEEP